VVVRRGGRDVLGPITLAIADREFVGVVGPNGAGKTTLLRVLAGLQEIAGGEADSCGHRVGGRRRDPALRSAVGFLFQHHEFLPDLPFLVHDVVTFGRTGRIGLGRRPVRDDRRAVDRAVELLGLGDLKNRLYRELSGGERQKVQLARLLAQEAQLLLLDEPAAGLDLDWQERMVALVELVHRSARPAVVIVTHEVDHLPRCCQRVLLLRDGLELDCGAPDQVLTPATLGRLYGCEMEVSADGGRYHAHGRRPFDPGSPA